MKILFAVHGYPPELVGGTENSTQALARSLAREGHAVIVVAGSIRPAQGPDEVETSVDEDPASGAQVRVLRIPRSDVFSDHWHKSLAPGVTRRFRAILREERPALVHVQHWIRLSRDLVLAAAREAVPAVVTLNDAWTSCLVAFRVRPDTLETCEVPIAGHPCLACAGKQPPRTPWVTREMGRLALGERQRDLTQELKLARARIAPSRTHAAALERFLELAPGELDATIVAPALWGEAELLARVPPALPPPSERLLLGAWGHLSPHKGVELLLEAQRRLAPDVPVELRFAGAEAVPGFLAQLRTLAAGVETSFHGAYAPGELAAHPVSAVHAHVSATRAQESYALVVDEARALGMPVVLPRTPLFEERARPGTLLYRAGDVDALVEALRSLARDESFARLRSEALATRTRSRGDPVAEHLAVYERAVREGPPRVSAQNWFEARLAQELLDAWDRSLMARTPAELGFVEPGPA